MYSSFGLANQLVQVVSTNPCALSDVLCDGTVFQPLQLLAGSAEIMPLTHIYVHRPPSSPPPPSPPPPSPPPPSPPPPIRGAPRVYQEAELGITIAGDNCSFAGISLMEQSVQDFFSYTGTVIVELIVTCRIEGSSEGGGGQRHLMEDGVSGQLWKWSIECCQPCVHSPFDLGHAVFVVVA